MTDDAIPQWVLDEAHKRLTAEGPWFEPTNHAIKVLARKDYIVRDAPLADLRAFIAAYHYARGSSLTAVYKHGMYDVHTGRLVGAALWLPPTRVCAESVNKENWQRVVSLSRLAVSPDMPTNAASFLIGQSIRIIRKEGKWKSLVTYADTRQGHTGTIYKATNWQFVGQVKGSPTWINPADGRQVACKSTKNRNNAQMIELGYERVGTFPKLKFVMHLN